MCRAEVEEEEKEEEEAVEEEEGYTAVTVRYSLPARTILQQGPNLLYGILRGPYLPWDVWSLETEGAIDSWEP